MEQKTKKRTPPPRNGKAFKAGAGRLVTEQERQRTDVIKELGICIDTLQSWLKASGIHLGQASRLNREQQASQELEVSRNGYFQPVEPRRLSQRDQPGFPRRSASHNHPGRSHRSHLDAK